MGSSVELQSAHLYDSSLQMEGFTGHWRRWQCYNTLLTGTKLASLSAHTGSDTDSGSRGQPPTGKAQQQLLLGLSATAIAVCH